MNSLQKVYMECIHALINIDNFFKHGADTQYGLMNYIAKFSLAKDSYLISEKARSLLPIKDVYTRGTDFPRKNKTNPEHSFTFEHPVPASFIRTLLITSDRKIENVAQILEATSHVVVLTQSENKEIPKNLTAKMPADWRIGDDPYIRYKDTSITLQGSIRVKGAIRR